MIKRSFYSKRRFLRLLETLWSRVEGFINRLTGVRGLEFRPYNPLYNLGTLAIFLLIVLAITGAYLTIFYRPSADRSYETVAWMSSTWFGSLMRSGHLYASDGLALLIFLHAIKMFISDRFWGSRWLGWVSGVILLLIIWVVGLMGYWLVWDQRGQWLTEYSNELLKGAFALSFLSPDLAAQTFAFFVILLFLHIFLSVLIVVGLLVHVIRLTRTRLWSPRWLMVGATIILVALSLWKPATSAPPADMGRMVGTVFLDGWYLGFLPFVAHWGTLTIWGITLLVIIVVIALSWLLQGRTMGPAQIVDTFNLCTGCSLCFLKCPYGAIEMQPRSDGAKFDTQAIVYPTLCTGCGMCVGTCATASAQLTHLPTTDLLPKLKQSLAAATAASDEVAPLVIFTCRRHATLNTLPDFTAPAIMAQPNGEVTFNTSLSATIPSPINLGAWSADKANGSKTPILTCVLPCTGMLQSGWVKDVLDQGAQAAFIVSCPVDDCSHREGPYWLGTHLRRRRSLLRRGVHWLETAPGEQKEVIETLTALEAGTAPTANNILMPGSKMAAGETPADTLATKLRPMAVGLLLLALAFFLAPLVGWSATPTSPGEGKLRVAIHHAGQFKSASTDVSAEVEAKLPDNVSVEQVLGGERFPVRLRVKIGQEPEVEQLYPPRGFRKEGAIYGLETWTLPPGTYEVEIHMMDDEETWQPTFAGPVEIKEGFAKTLTYDNNETTFILH